MLTCRARFLFGIWCWACAALAQAEDAGPETILARPGRLWLSESFARPVEAIIAGRDSKAKQGWHLYSGQWDFVDGALRGRQMPDDGRSAFVVYHHPFTSVVVQFDFRMDGCRQVIFRIQDAIPEHICSVRINQAGFSAQKDDHDHQGPDVAVPFGQAGASVAAGKWKTMLIEIKGDTMAATMDGHTIRGSHPLLAAEKATIEFVVTGASASFRHLRIWDVVPAE
jgi:hypothetical protein